MDDSKARRVRRAAAGLPWGLLGALALVLAIEGVLERRRDRWASPTAAGFEWAYRSATADPAVADVVVLGDSVLKFGFAPRVFERAAGRRADNWSTIGNPPAVALGLLEAHLRAGGKPRAIFVDFKPLLLEKGVHPDLGAWSRIASLGDGFGLALETRDADFAARFLLARTLPSYRDRWAIRDEFVRGLGGLPEPDRTGEAARGRNWRVNRGGHLLPPDPRAATLAEFPNERANLRPDWTCQPANLACLARFFERAAAGDVPVYWILPPVHPRLRAGREALGLELEFGRFVLDQAAKAPGRVTVVDGRRLGIGPDRFVDATHLDRRGALEFTAALAAWFAGSGASGPARVDLGAVDSAEVAAWGAGLEDTDASALAIRRGEAEPPTRVR